MFTRAAEIARELSAGPYAASEEGILSGLRRLIDATACVVEEAKKVVERSGTHAVLDEISKKMLTHSGLLGRTLVPDGTSGDAQPDPAAVKPRTEPAE